MKLFFLLFYAHLLIQNTKCGVIPEEEQNSQLQKRSSDDAFQYLKSTIANGIKSKIAQFAKGSVSASGYLSGGSSHHHGDYDPHGHKSFDFWSLKKSILNTLLQAVKAIKGGVIAIKGQLIKGSGYLISAKGKLISSKGEALTNLGKSIATSAVLAPPLGHHHEAYVGPEIHGAPSAPGPEFDIPEHHYHHHVPYHEEKPDPVGLLILKKIPEHHDHLHEEPGLGEIVGKFFKASTSLQPGEPVPFGDVVHHVEEKPVEYPPSSGGFEDAPHFVNHGEYASESKEPPPVVEKNVTKDEIRDLPESAPLKYDEIRYLPNLESSPPEIATFKPLMMEPIIEFGAFPNVGYDQNLKFLTAAEQGAQGFDYPQYVKNYGIFDNAQAAYHKAALSRPSRSKLSVYHHRPNPYYYPSRYLQGPNKPKRL